MANLFHLRGEIEQALALELGADADVVPVLDLILERGTMRQRPTVHLFLNRIGQGEKHRGSRTLSLSQQWTVSITVPVSLADSGGVDAMDLAGELAQRVIKALIFGQFPQVKTLDLQDQTIEAGVVGQWLVVPLTFNAVIMQQF